MSRTQGRVSPLSYLRSDRTRWARIPRGRRRWRSSSAGRSCPRRRPPPPHTWASFSPRGHRSRSCPPFPPGSSCSRRQLLCLRCGCCFSRFFQSPWSPRQAWGHSALRGVTGILRTRPRWLAHALSLTIPVGTGNALGRVIKSICPFPPSVQVKKSSSSLNSRGFLGVQKFQQLEGFTLVPCSPSLTEDTVEFC